jgi:hypothetical protein
MGVIQQKGQFSGKSYSIQIAGDTPTPVEQQKIDSYLTQQEQPYKQSYEYYFGQRTNEDVPQEVPIQEEGGFRRAVGAGVDQLQIAYGSSLEGLGKVTGLEGLENYGSDVVEKNEQEFQEKAAGFTRLDDADSFGDYIKFYTETLGQQLPNLGSTLAGSGAGALAGSAFGPVGTFVGGIAGGMAANIPYFYGDNREAQKEAMERGLRTEMNEGAAFLYSIPQASLDLIVDRLLVGGILPKSFGTSGAIFTRGVKGVAIGNVVEIPTEIGQEVLNRYQAGLSIADEEALRVYRDVAIAAGLVGGTVRGGTNIIAGDQRVRDKNKEEQEKIRQLQEDQEEARQRALLKKQEINKSKAMIDEDLVEDVEEKQRKLEEKQAEVRRLAGVEEQPLQLGVMAPPPDNNRLSPEEEKMALLQAARETTLPLIPVELSTLPLDEQVRIRSSRRAQGVDTTTPASIDEIRRVLGEDVADREVRKQKPLGGGAAHFGPISGKSFTQSQYDRAVQEIKAQKKYTFNAVQKALKATGLNRVPRQMVLDVRDEMVNRGILRKSDRVRTGYVVEADIESSFDEAASYRKTVNDIRTLLDGERTAKKKAENETDEEFQSRKLGLRSYRRKLLEDARRAQQVEGNVRKARQLNAKADALEGEIARAEKTVTDLEKKIETSPQGQAIPATERPKVLSSDEKQAIGSQETTQGQREALQTSVNNRKAELDEKRKMLRRLKARKAPRPQVDQVAIRELENDIERLKYFIKSAQSKIDAPSSPVQVAPEAKQAKTARTVADLALNRRKSDVFTAKEQQVFNALRKRLTRLGLRDVNLTVEKTLARTVNINGQNVHVDPEGQFDAKDGNRIISLAMEAVDPNATAQEQFDALKGIMNHEVIHALKNLGLFTKQEYASLVKAAKAKKYVAIKDGVPTERKYSYYDRARSMYEGIGASEATIEEEAVAELFRDYADNKIKLSGKPRTLMQRIKDFFVGIVKGNNDVGISSVEDIFDNIRSGNIGARGIISSEKRPFQMILNRDFGDPEGDVESQSLAFSLKNFTPKLPFAPDGARAHKLPHQLLIEGSGRPETIQVTQKYTRGNAERNNSSIEQILEQHPNATDSVQNWMDAMQDAFGGEYIPAPPLVAIQYSSSPEAMAEKLKDLTPELRKGVDEGFKHVKDLQNIYSSGNATPRMTLDLFIWGILSRGAGPVQQESAYIDIIDQAHPLLEKAAREPLTEDDLDRWMLEVSTSIPEGSPGKQVTMNVNAAAKLVSAMSQMVPNTNRTTLDLVHEQMIDANVSASDIRETFLANTEGAGIDNKVLSFILLVAGKDDVLVMDRIQGRHLWDDGRYGGSNIYDGIGPNNEGLNGIFRGPRGILVTRMLENGMRKNIDKAYELVGRPQDASLGRFHWETWVIEGEQVVNHGSLKAIIDRTTVGTRVTEGKTDTFSSNMTYMRGLNATVVEYPLSDGDVVYMTPQTFKDFTNEMSNDAKKKNSKTGIFKQGNFKVSSRADIPWFERVDEIDRGSIDKLAREYEDAKPNGSVLRSDERTGKNKDASRRGNSDLDRRYSLGFLTTTDTERLLKEKQLKVRRDEKIGGLKGFIQNNPDGFTISPETMEPVSGGFVVAPLKEAEIIVGQELPEQVLIDYIEDNKAIAEATGRDVYLGGWFDTESNQYFLDNTLIVDSKEEALYIAEASEQLAIFDLNTFEEVRTNDGISELKQSGAYKSDTAIGYKRNAEEIGRRFAEARDQRNTLEREQRVKGEVESSIEPSPFTEEEIQTIEELTVDTQSSESTSFSLGNIEPETIMKRPDLDPDDIRSNAHGFINNKPVFLRAGENIQTSRTGVGTGLRHILERRHEGELKRDSNYGKYPRPVQKAIIDVLERFKRQGFKSSPDGVQLTTEIDNGVPTATLEWKENTPEGSPPITLVLVRDRENPKAAFEVKTFYVNVASERRGVVNGKVQFSLNPASLPDQIEQKQYYQNYARSADFIAKAFRIALPADRAQKAADEVLRRFQDSFLPVGRMIQELKEKGLNIVDAMDTYLKEELYHRKTTNELLKREKGIYKNATDALKQLNVTDAEVSNLQRISDSAAGGKGFVSQAIESSQNKVLALGDIYLYASHAKERNAYIRANKDSENNEGSGMSDREADAILDWFSSLNAENRTAISNFGTAIKGIVEDTNKVRIDSGLIPKEFVEFTNYQNYVPLRGVFDPENEQDIGLGASLGGAFGARGRQDPKALGRYAYATDILATTIAQNQNSVVRSEKNLVAQSFLKLLRADTEKTGVYAKILDRVPTQRRTIMSDGKPVTREMPDFNAAQDPMIMVVKENGSDVYVRFEDEKIAKAMKGNSGLGSASMNAINRGMLKINRYLSNINTSYNPEFVVSNFLRDLQTAGVNVQQYEEQGMTKAILKGVGPALKGIKKAIRDNDFNSEWSKIYNDFVEAGGKNATNQMDTIADQMNNLRGILGDIGEAGQKNKFGIVKKKFLGKGKSLLQFMEDYNTIVENGVRVATYKALLDRGYSRERAAQAAGSVTVNFSKGGEYRSLMNAWYLFYNASLQGSFALLNAATRSKKVQKIWMGVIAAGVLQDQLNSLVSDEEEDGKLTYDKIPEYVLEHNLIIMNPFSDRGYISIPMPYGLNMAHNVGRAMSQLARGGTDLKGAGNSIVGTTIDTLSPIGGIWDYGIDNAVAPTIADPFIDVISNQDFTGKPVFKEGFPGDRTPSSQLYWSTTSPTAKFVADNINSLTGGSAASSGLVDVSPDVLEFWFEYITGGVGRFAQRTAELPTKLSGDGLQEELYRSIPFSRKIYSSVSDREDLSDYIEKRDQILVAFDELKAAGESGNAERLAKIRTDYADEIKFIGIVRQIENQRRKIARQINNVRDSRTLTDEKKQELLDKLDEAKQKLTKRANVLLKEFN